MPKKPALVSKEYIIAAPLPEKTETYTVIPHEFVINKTLEKLKEKGFEVESEHYRCNLKATIASGVYYLKFQGDPELGMMFAWSNSYDKTMRFKCAIGGFVFSNRAGMISGDMGAWSRKHSGTADQETETVITHQIESAEIYYAQLVQDKEQMKTVQVPIKRFSELLGVLYFEHGLLTSEQLCSIKNQYKRPGFDYKVPKDNLWANYNHVIFALKQAHPKTWMDQQRLIHWFLCEEFIKKPDEPVATEPSVSPVVDPEPKKDKNSKQLDLVDEIAKIESEQGARDGADAL